VSAAPYDYAHDNLSMALGLMAWSSATLRKRLLLAYQSYLFKLHERDFPPELSQRYSALIDAMSTMPARYPHEGTVQSTLEQTHPLKIKAMIKEISSIQYSLVHIRYN